MSLFTNDLVSTALEIAVRAHDGQPDKSGNPYVLHPIAVANMFVVPQFQVVALLHDVIEDNDSWTADRLRYYGIPQRLVDAVTAITHLAPERREIYYERVRRNPIALLVKLADIAHNTSPERIALLDEETKARLSTKYHKAKRILLKNVEWTPCAACGNVTPNFPDIPTHCTFCSDDGESVNG